MYKKCRYCGKPLPEEAAFCPYCARSQLEAQEAPEPPRPPKKPPLLPIALLAAAALLLCVGWRLLRTPQPEVPPETSVETTVPLETTLPPETTSPTTEAETEPTEEAVTALTGTRWANADWISSLWNGPDGYFEYYEQNLEGEMLYHIVRHKTGDQAEVTIYRDNGEIFSHYYTADVEGTLAARGVDLNNLPENRFSLSKGFKVIP